LRVTVAIPCLDEAPTIGKVVAEFRAQLPQAEILVVDNGSSDGSPEAARAAGAGVVEEPRRGKGHAIQRILSTTQAQVCVVVDGDDTYFAEDVHALLRAMEDGSVDMAVGDRLGRASSVALSDVRRLGNRIFLALINLVFRSSLRDPLSGYRAFSRRFVESVSLSGGGFETETELTLRALEQGLRIVEIPIHYRARPEGSHSKLSPLVDGLRILSTIGLRLLRQRPGLVLGTGTVAVILAGSAQAVAWAGGWLPGLGAPGHAIVLAASSAVVSGLLALWIVLAAAPGSRQPQASVAPPAEGAAGLAAKGGPRGGPA